MNHKDHFVCILLMWWPHRHVFLTWFSTSVWLEKDWTQHPLMGWAASCSCMLLSLTLRNLVEPAVFFSFNWWVRRMTCTPHAQVPGTMRTLGLEPAVLHCSLTHVHAKKLEYQTSRNCVSLMWTCIMGFDPLLRSKTWWVVTPWLGWCPGRIW